MNRRQIDLHRCFLLAAFTLIVLQPAQALPRGNASGDCVQRLQECYRSCAPRSQGCYTYCQETMRCGGASAAAAAKTGGSKGPSKPESPATPQLGGRGHK
jgi:hypothetical protein